MREIKFRAWNKKKNAWDTFITEFVDYENKTISLSIPENSHLIIMQFTGLHDKNGKEIYEGDRLGNFYNVVEFLNDSWCINGDRPLSMFLHEEVVGNIYENPTL